MISPWTSFRNLETIIDIRSPEEYGNGHIPSAQSLPAIIDLRELKALPPAAELSRSDLRQYFHNWEEFRAELAGKVTNSLGVYCASGGMRSAVVQKLWDLPTQLHLLEGGFESFRNELGKLFYYPWRLIRITGRTGVGKTEVLNALATMGSQVIDLEAIARHRGSVFGGSVDTQPGQHYFEIKLSEVLSACRPRQRIFVEQKGRHLGALHLPEPFDARVASADYIELISSKDSRLDRLVESYGKLPVKDLEENIKSLEPRLGSVNTELALDSLQTGNLKQCASRLLDYYDVTDHYRQREGSKIFEVLHENTEECAAEIQRRLKGHFSEYGSISHNIDG